MGSNILFQLYSRQSDEAQVGEPYLRYLSEVWNLMGTGRLQIAHSLEVYARNIAAVIGYKDGSLLILKKDELFKAVQDAFLARNECLPISVDEVSRKLKAAGLTKYDANGCLIKSSSLIPGRPRMLALIEKNV